MHTNTKIYSTQSEPQVKELTEISTKDSKVIEKANGDAAVEVMKVLELASKRLIGN